MIICVSGSVCTGKTTLAKMIAKKYKMKYIDVNKLIKSEKLYDSYDSEFDTLEVDVNKLKKFMKKFLKGKNNLVLDSHLSHYLDCGLCYIVKCDIKILRERLKKRKYSDLKIEENVEAEIMDVCLNEAKERGLRIKVVDSSKGLKMCYL